MKIGISLACFYPECPENTVARARNLGFDTAELFVNTFSELEDEYIYSFKKLCEKNELNIYSLHPFTSALENYLFFSVYERRVEDAKKLYSKYCRAAKILGAKVINIHGDKGVGLKDLDTYVRCLDPLLEVSALHGVYLSHENVFYNSINHPEFIYQLKKKLGDGTIKFTLDLKQANRGGGDPYEICDAMGGDVVNFHINDYDDDHMCMLPGQGVVDHGIIMKKLISNGYDGPALIEVYSDNYKSDYEIVTSRKYLEKIKLYK